MYVDAEHGVTDRRCEGEQRESCIYRDASDARSVRNK